jgi:hypothetical protein
MTIGRRLDGVMGRDATLAPAAQRCDRPLPGLAIDGVGFRAGLLAVLASPSSPSIPRNIRASC